LKKFVLILFCILITPPVLASDREIFILSKLISQNFNESNPKSLINLVNELNKESTEINLENKKAFFIKASKIFVKQKKIKKTLQKISSTSTSKKTINQLYAEIKKYRFRSRSIRFNENDMLNRQISINNQIQSIMNDIEEDLEIAKEKLLEYPDESGIFGLTEKISGNCMPILETNSLDCSYEIKPMEMVIRKPARIENFDNSGNLIDKPDLVTKIKSNDNGFFEINLEPGTYSVMIVKDDQEKCTNKFSEDDIACGVFIENGPKSFYKPTLDEAFW
jgi:hypothetical protein